MDPTLILAAFVRFTGLTYVAGTISLLPSLWSYYTMTRQYSALPRSVSSAYAGFESVSCQIAIHLAIALIFWFCAVPLSKYLLRSKMCILLPIIVFAGWILVAILPVGRLAIEDALNDVPTDQRRGTSVFPAIPFVPLFIWGVSTALDHWISPRIAYFVILAHVLLILLCSVVIFRDWARLRTIGRKRAPERGVAGPH